MAANVPNPGNYLAGIGNLFTNLRDNFRMIQDQNNYIGSMGGAAFLTATAPNGLGMSANDAAALQATLGNLANLANQYQGGPAAAQLNYQANSEPFWGGQ